MKESLKKILFIASVALNVVFIGTYLAYELPTFAGAGPPPAVGKPLFLQLDLTPDQLSRVKEARDKLQARLRELTQVMRIKQVELIALLAKTPFDQQAVKAKQKEIQHLQGVVQDRVIAHFLRVSAVLDPQQRGRFFKLLEARFNSGLRACPPWMKGCDQSRPGPNMNK